MMTSWESRYNAVDKLPLDKVENKVIKSMIKKAYRSQNITKENINRRFRYVVETHIVLCTVIQEQFRRLGLANIASIFGKNHATILHYKRCYYDFLFQDENFSSLHRELTNIALHDLYDGKGVNLEDKTKSEIQEELASVIAENARLKRKIQTVSEILDV